MPFFPSLFYVVLFSLFKILNLPLFLYGGNCKWNWQNCTHSLRHVCLLFLQFACNNSRTAKRILVDSYKVYLEILLTCINTLQFWLKWIQIKVSLYGDFNAILSRGSDWVGNSPLLNLTRTILVSVNHKPVEQMWGILGDDFITQWDRR
jgi:hypothetical protein